ncbi:putative acyl carrier protein [Catenulispora acidiphila DSM 44928]|uniref:Putative acyl carrier protein n=1 Tax=Catenulispora acidiphila (strain DSM 44928 / JCM 14897 / NBRC 102108 / NRRL B-24433 / ID139908) TaxID=479433 RepID=C7Q957_CATAD|nr:phosphopantetheine-binding protein [Catenulispora acidiphila]ACU72377.1 putative acyl carrier protein [Catenulispora acidiphila DSM 44928]
MSVETTTSDIGAGNAEAVLAEVAAMLRSILDEYALDDIDIEWNTRFHDDLELESVDLVTLAGMLAERYGERVNLAEFIADLGLEEIIELTVGQLVEHVTTALKNPSSSDAEMS